MNRDYGDEWDWDDAVNLGDPFIAANYKQFNVFDPAQ
jgi:hypothetical protein